MPNGFYTTALASFGKHWRRRHLKIEELIELFQHAYQNLETPLALCEGLEIIAFNEAFVHLIKASGLDHSGEKLEGRLLDSIIREQSQVEMLFGKTAVQTQVTLGHRNVQLSARNWQYGRHLKILEWQDQSFVDDLQAGLSKARNIDPTTGTLLPTAFQKQARLNLPNTDHVLVVLVQIAECNSSVDPLCDEKMGDTLMHLAQAMEQELDEATLIGRPNSSTLSLFTPFEGEDGEQEHIMRQIKRVSSAVAKGHSCYVGASLYPQCAKSVDQLYAQALLALKHATETNETTLFDKKLAETEKKHRQLQTEMADALVRNEITPFFQPVINAQSGQIKGFEALIRWFHPTLGFVSPPDIIDIARQSNQLHKLTAHVLQHAVEQMADWPAPIQFAVNVTPSQLTGELVNMVRSVIRGAGVDPSRLEIEVTEDALIADFDASANIFARLRAIGVSVAMDDFGAGYTSMSNLRKLDFNKIKIDKSISDGLPSDKKSVAIVKSLMFMAGELDVDVTVEGIETEDQLAFLRSFDCGVQGYVFAKPMPIKDLAEMKKFLAPSIAPHPKAAIVGFGPRTKNDGNRLNPLIADDRRG